MYDAEFHAFLELTTLVTKLLGPGQRQLTFDEADAVRACAKKLAKDLTSGEYE
jgi:hypothetical protein